MRSDRGAVANLLAIVLGGAAGVIVGGALGFFGGGEAPAGGILSLDGVPAYACPGDGEVATLYRGDRILITGRSGDWLAVRNVRGTNERVFIHTDYVTPDAELSGLPEQNCDDSGVLTLASVETTTTTEAPETTAITEAPDTTATTEAPPPTTGTTAAPPTTGTTAPPPDTTPPSISNAAASPTQIWEQDGGVFNITCSPPEPRQSSVSANVTDTGGVASVTANWTDPLGGHNVTMNASGSTYSTTIGPYPADTWPIDPLNHTLSVTILAIDGSGNQSTSLVQFAIWSIGQCFG